MTYTIESFLSVLSACVFCRRICTGNTDSGANVLDWITARIAAGSLLHLSGWIISGQQIFSRRPADLNGVVDRNLVRLSPMVSLEDPALCIRTLLTFSIAAPIQPLPEY